ncbi:MAG: hypothetical protein ABIQ02_13495, partial [Saprospiraceae bacterium]
TTQCITVGDTGCVCVSFTDGSGFDTLCLQYNLCNLTGEILAPAQACAGDLIRISFESNDSTLEGGLWTVMLDSANTQTYELTDSLWLTFDSTGCYAISLMLQDSGCTVLIADTICIVDKPTGFICCDQLTCDSCVNLTVYFEGTPPFSFAITDGLMIDTVSEINNLAYDYQVCPPYDTTVIYTLLWVSDLNAACDGAILTPSASIYLEPFPVATITVQGDTLCAGPAGQFYHWVDCQDTTSLGFDQCFVPSHSGCYCVTVRTVLTDCEDTACINHVISATHDIKGSEDSKIMYEPDNNSLLIQNVIQHTEELNIELFDLLGRNIPFSKKEYPDDHSVRVYLTEHMTSIAFIHVSSETFNLSRSVFIYYGH